MDERRLASEDDPFDVGEGDLEAVARRYEAHLNQIGAEGQLERARADIAAGRTISLAELADRGESGPAS